MHNLKNLFIKHIDAGLYPGVEWKIIHQNNVFAKHFLIMSLISLRTNQNHGK